MVEVNSGNDGNSKQLPQKKRTNLCKCSNFLPEFWLIFM